MGNPLYNGEVILDKYLYLTDLEGREIMKVLPTPYFVVDKGLLCEGLEKLKAALTETWPNYVIGYSYKTNALPWIIRFFKEQGCYAEVVSDDEYNLALTVGSDPDKLIYNGIAKSKETFLNAIRNHAIVNIDSEYEIDWLDELGDGIYEVGIRVNFDLESKCPGQTQCGDEGERFGFCYENGELKRAIERIKEKGVTLSGVHLHKSSKTRMPGVYRAIAESAVEITKQYKLHLKYIDIGGGFFGGLPTKPQFSEYFNMIAEILRTAFCPGETKLIVEPGMALVGSAVEYVTSVRDVKKTTRNIFVVTDGSRTQVDPLMTKTRYFHELVMKDDNREYLEKQVVVGFTCMEHDRLFELQNEKALLPGDRIVYHKVGAYTMCLSPLFIKWFPEVYVRDGDTIMKVRNRWGAKDYMLGSIFE